MPAKSAKMYIKMNIQVCTFLYCLLPADAGKLCIPLVYACYAIYFCYLYIHKDMHVLILLPAAAEQKEDRQAYT